MTNRERRIAPNFVVEYFASSLSGNLHPRDIDQASRKRHEKQVRLLMTDQTTDPILIPAALSPAAAEEVRNKTLQLLEAAKDTSDSISLDIDGESLTPCAVQILVAASRTAERMGVSLQMSEQGQTALSELQTI